MDGGNSHYAETERRSRELDAEDIRYMGVGVSGGEEGALWGPSIMPGGDVQAYQIVDPVLTSIAAKVDGEPCVTYIGPRGSGHFVKMVHNGIEYGDMQLIAEAYDLMNRGLRLSADVMADVFAGWNEGVLSSYLIEITADVLRRNDEKTGQPLVDLIMDQAGQKGTGRWTSQTALELGVPTPTIDSAVGMRILSSFKQERIIAAGILTGPEAVQAKDGKAFISALGHALYCAKIGSYAQGFSMLRVASHEFAYDLNLSEIARIWRGGCIIRARFLDDVREAYAEVGDLDNLLLASFFKSALAEHQKAFRSVVGQAIEWGIPVPGMAASLAYYDAYRSSRLPANLIQAQRDYFGAHTYRRVDRQGTFHTDWGKRGGKRGQASR
jgi:6-phosphogluconate dehydrogenase